MQTERESRPTRSSTTIHMMQQQQAVLNSKRICKACTLSCSKRGWLLQAWRQRRLVKRLVSSSHDKLRLIEYEHVSYSARQLILYQSDVRVKNGSDKAAVYWCSKIIAAQVRFLKQLISKCTYCCGARKQLDRPTFPTVIAVVALQTFIRRYVYHM